MIKYLVQALPPFFLLMSTASAQVDANLADRAALDGVKGIGPTTSQAILVERRRNGPYRDWSDFEQRVPGIGERRALALSGSGLTVDGKGRPDRLPAAKPAVSPAAFPAARQR